MLKQGDEGDEVAALVADLRRLGFQLKPSRIFDSTVKRSVEAFQVGKTDASGQPLAVDGKVGPNTRWALDVALGKSSLAADIDVGLPPILDLGNQAGRQALEVAIEEAADKSGEEGEDNHGPDIRRYYDGHADEGASWCAAFVSYCFRKGLGRDADFGYLIGAQAIHNRMRALGHAYPASLQDPPQPGDIITWLRIDPTDPEGTAWQGHVGIVHSFQNGILWTIEGNRGSYPSKVKAFRYSWSDLVVSATNDRFKGLYGLSRHP